MSKLAKRMKKINIKNACRTCLTERGHLRDITNTKIPKMIEYCASIQIDEEDMLPKQICVSCFHHIAKYYTFKKKMERSNRILLNYIKLNKNRIKKDLDILCKAVNEAEIDEKSNDDDNIPLSHFRREIEFEEIIIEDPDVDFEGDIIDGPPPLIPIAKNDTICDNDNTIALVADAPPLIPIKPIEASEIDKVAPDLQLECTVCGEEFNSAIALKQHRQFKCQSNGLQCNICKKEFTDRKKLIGHLKGHMIVKVHVCKLCGKRYPNQSTFTVHMRTHTGERPFKCQICDKGFVRWAGVVGHMKTHNSIKPFKCETCGKAFKIATNLERHKVLHSGCLPFCCNFCGKTFSQADNLQLHIRTYHTFEKPFLCNECGKSFVSSTRLNRHMWVHSGYKPYKCKDCTKSYSNRNDLKNHSRIHSGTQIEKPFGCDSCDMKFSYACRLKQHMKIHELKYCQQCNKSYTSYFSLNRHIEVKHLQKQFFIGKDDYVDEPEIVEEETVPHDDQNVYI